MSGHTSAMRQLCTSSVHERRIIGGVSAMRHFCTLHFRVDRGSAGYGGKAQGNCAALDGPGAVAGEERAT